MTTIETGDSQHRVFCDVENRVNDVAGMRVESGRGALVLVGPSAGELCGIDALLELPNVESVEAIGTRMASWNTVGAEVIEVGRSASHLIRNGQTAVVHLDSHSGAAPAIPVDDREFVCARLGQILIGIADAPAYVVAHGERMGRSLIIDSLEDCGVEALGSVDAACPIWRLSAATMFPGLCVAICPGDRPADPIVGMIDWFEAQRD
mgnify:CR=1 FL=1